MDTARPELFLSGTAQVGCGRDVPPPPAPLGAWIVASLPSAPGPKVLRCLYAMNSSRDAAWWISLAIVLAVDARSSASEMTGGG